MHFNSLISIEGAAMSSGPIEDSSTPEGPKSAELKRALQAFKKRLKLMKLDDESRTGGRQMSGGFKSGIMAISPPDTQLT